MEPKFLNFYRCPECISYYEMQDDDTRKPVYLEWYEIWSCTCNDPCPECGAEIEPYRSEDITADPKEEGPDIVICIEDGLIQAIHASNPDIKVAVYDFDIFEGGGEFVDNQGRKKETFEREYNEDVQYKTVVY